MTTPPVETFEAMLECLKLQQSLIMKVCNHLDMLKQDTPATGDRYVVQQERKKGSVDAINKLSEQISAKLKEAETGFNDWAK